MPTGGCAGGGRLGGRSPPYFRGGESFAQAAGAGEEVEDGEGHGRRVRSTGEGSSFRAEYRIGACTATDARGREAVGRIVRQAKAGRLVHPVRHGARVRLPRGDGGQLELFGEE